VGHSLQVTHAAKYPAPILSMGVSPDCTTLAVGTSSGLLSIRQRKKPDKLDAGTATALGVARPRGPRKLHPNNYRYFLRGGAESAAEDDYVLARPKKVNLGQHDQFLRSFQYREALSSALSTSDPTVCIVIPNEEECFLPGMIGAYDSFLLCR
jgi:U3 small nucleolar RNA-associated protein 15